MIVVLPVLLYPALGFGMIQLTLRFGQELRRVGLVGAEHLPSVPPLLTEDGARFHESLFLYPEKNQKSFEVLLRPDWSKEDLIGKRIDTLIVIPEGTNDRIAAGEQVQLQVLRNGTDDNSEIAYRLVLGLLDVWEDEVIADRMARIGKDQSFANPIELGEEESDVSAAQDRSGTAWGKVFPFLLVMMALTGAFYPAIDLCAGEKERGTMETLLITPAARGEIVLGKFLTIFLFSVATTIFNLSSMGLTFAQLANLVPAGLPGTANRFTPPSLLAIFWMLILMLPLSGFFSALCMALAIFARSTKEGQYYLMPMFLLVTPLIFLTLAPGVELTPFYSLVPVTNVALLLRTLMLHQYDVAAVYFLPVLIPTILYGYLALRYAVEQFRREDVLFREAERFSVGLWIRHLLRDKEETPTSGEAWFAYVLMLLLVWYTQGLIPEELVAIPITQLGFIAFPSIILALLFTRRPRISLGIRKPDWTVLFLAVPLALAIHPVAVEIGNLMREYMPVSPEVEEALKRLTADAAPWELVLAFAVLPAICEELAFRGFILAGLSRKHPAGRAIVISAILFGVFHMMPQQMLTASLLGLLLGLLAIRSGSIFPGMLYHVLHNGLLVIQGESLGGEGYGLLVVLGGALAAVLMIGFLIHRPTVSRLPYGKSQEDPWTNPTPLPASTAANLSAS